ncbi:hypothetical protein D8832_02975 [Streptococcus intermedius]|nr:hypothetical protein D8832_02975 [Streptococcus intermedius]
MFIWNWIAIVFGWLFFLSLMFIILMLIFALINGVIEGVKKGLKNRG